MVGDMKTDGTIGMGSSILMMMECKSQDRKKETNKQKIGKFVNHQPIVGLNQLGPFWGLHRPFAADDVAGIHTPANLINCYSKSTDTAFISIALLYTLFRNLFYRLLFSHDFLLSTNKTISFNLFYLKEPKK
jgi:hypothetical protein